MRQPGRHFVQIPGPTNVPDAVLRATARPTMDHRSAEFAEFGKKILERIKTVYKCEGPVFIYPASGTGAWQAAMVNTMSPGDKVLMYETGQFSNLWKAMADSIGVVPELIPGDWRTGVDLTVMEERLAKDKAHEIKTVCIVHNETATGCRSSIPGMRKVLDGLKHPALLMVDAVSALGSMDYRHDEWGIDVGVSGSQKGLMLPPGLSFTAVSAKALEAAKTAKLGKGFWSWDDQGPLNAQGFFPYTPAVNLLYGLDVAIDLLHAEGLDKVFARHERHAEATRRAVRAWGLEIQCRKKEDYSSSVTTVRMPDGHSGDAFRRVVAEKFNMSLGSGLAQLADKVFRIGHIGDFNDLMLAGALSGVEMGLKVAGVPHKDGGVQAALDYLKAKNV
jgi:alanine-glyoxylate transaminase/serine-glyoxylate transaminase/serine-pyruvate transaminase